MKHGVVFYTSHEKEKQFLYKELEEEHMFKKLKECFRTVNLTNSSMRIQCVALDKCRLRHTTSCDNCKNNIGKYEEKNYYEPR